MRRVIALIVEVLVEKGRVAEVLAREWEAQSKLGEIEWSDGEEEMEAEIGFKVGTAAGLKFASQKISDTLTGDVVEGGACTAITPVLIELFATQRDGGLPEVLWREDMVDGKTAEFHHSYLEGVRYAIGEAMHKLSKYIVGE